MDPWQPELERRGGAAACGRCRCLAVLLAGGAGLAGAHGCCSRLDEIAHQLFVLIMVAWVSGFIEEMRL
jgi:hypothetical protein